MSDLEECAWPAVSTAAGIDSRPPDGSAIDLKSACCFIVRQQDDLGDGKPGISPSVLQGVCEPLAIQ
jgi:hypothetical protein